MRTGILALALLAGAVAAIPAQAKTTIKFAVSFPDSALPQVQGMKAFKSYVESRSSGELEIRTIYGQLGGDRELMEQMRNGTLEMSILPDGPVSGFYKNMQVLSLPYLFPSSPVAWAFFDSAFATRMRDDVRLKTGVRVLTFMENGFRNFTNSVREVKTPADMKGMKMRTMESPVFMRLVNSLGAAATPIAFPELIMSLQQKVVDGQENATGDIYENGMVDVQKFMSITEHVYGVNLVAVAEPFFKTLPPDQQRIIQEGAKVLAAVNNGAKVSAHSDYIAKIKAKGVAVHFTTVEEKRQFRDLAQGPVREYLAGQVGVELVNEMLSAVEQSEKALYGQ